MNDPARSAHLAHNAAAEAASLIARDLFLFRQPGPHADTGINNLDMVVHQVATSYAHHAADEHDSRQAAHYAAVRTLATMLLEAIAASPVTEANC